MGVVEYVREVGSRRFRLWLRRRPSRSLEILWPTRSKGSGFGDDFSRERESSGGYCGPRLACRRTRRTASFVDLEESISLSAKREPPTLRLRKRVSPTTK